MSNPNPHSRWPAAARTVAAAAALVGYASFLAIHFSPVAGNSDSSGYLNSARLLAEGRLTTTLRTVPELGRQPWNHFVPLGFVGDWDSNRLTPTYPVGLPLHLAAAAAAAGWRWGPLAVGVGAALAAVLLCWSLGRELGLDPPFASAAAAAIALSPLVVWDSIQVYSDVLALAWSAGAVLAALRARTRVGRDLAWSAACGAACGIAVLVRPTNLLLLPALVILLGNGRRLGAALMGGLPAALGLAWYQSELYGSPFRSGYGEAGYLFGLGHVAPNLAHLAAWLPQLLPVAWLALLPFFLLPWRHHARAFAALLGWLGAFLAFHAFYLGTSADWTGVRFLLPAFPAVALLAGLGAQAVAGRAPEARRRLFTFLGAGAIVGASLANLASHSHRLGLLRMKQVNRAYTEAVAAAQDAVPPEALVAGFYVSGCFYFYTDTPILRYDQLDPETWRTYARTLAHAGRPVFAVLWDLEMEEALERRMPGTWEPVARYPDGGIWKLVSPP